MKFNLLPTTTVEQSNRLLEYGVKPETADGYYEEDGHVIIARDDYDLEVALHYRHLPPAWSLSRLIEMFSREVPDKKDGFEPHHPELIIHNSGYNLSIRRSTADCRVGTHIEQSPVECCVSMISWLIRNGYFNKEYLKSK